MSIRLRLMLAVLSVICLGMWLLYRQLVADLRPRYLETMEEAMVDMAEILAAVAAVELQGGADRPQGLATALDQAQQRRFEARIYALVKDRVATEVLITDAVGRVVYDSADEFAVGSDQSRWNDVLKTLRGEYGARATRRDPADARSLMMHVAAPIRVDGRVQGVLSVRRSVDSVTIFMDAAQDNLLWVLAVVALGVATVAAAASLWLTRPLLQLQRYVAAVREDRRVAPPRLGGEVAGVAAAVESLRDALEGRQYVERYVQHLTHELKSPLSSIRGAAELLEEDLPPAQRERFLANIRAEVERLQDLVQRLLQLAALEARKHLETAEPLDLGALAREVAADCATLAAARQQRIHPPQASAVVSGEAFLLRQALRNLVDNALDFVPVGGSVWIDLEQHDDVVVLAVADEGPGIPDFARDRVTERFYSLPRPETGRKGTGIGLTFVAEVAQLHHGRLLIGERPGGGARIELRLPVAPS